MVVKLTAIFIFVAVPFKTMDIIPGFTEIRPVNALNIVYGLLFGVYGALSCVAGNLISDILGGTLAVSSWAGFVSNFFGTYIAYILWYKFVKEKPIINDFKQITAFIIISFFIAFIISGIVTFGVKISYETVNSIVLFKSVFFNTVGFSVILGMPLLIAINEVYNIEKNNLLNQLKGHNLK